ncbi:signal peptidase II [Furfurilactobacillus sp. WILCCON 0119]
MLYYWLLIIALVGADQGIKYYITTQVSLGSTHTFIPGVLSLTNLRNDGAAWSLLEGRLDVFVIITIVAIAVLLYAMVRLRHQRLYMMGITIMMAGTLGNFLDRIRLHYVVDMFQFDFLKSFPISNFADWCLTVGVVLLIIAVLTDHDGDAEPKHESHPRHAK